VWVKDNLQINHYNSVYFLASYCLLPSYYLFTMSTLLFVTHNTSSLWVFAFTSSLANDALLSDKFTYSLISFKSLLKSYCIRDDSSHYTPSWKTFLCLVVIYSKHLHVNIKLFLKYLNYIFNTKIYKIMHNYSELCDVSILVCVG
jgi:hypothetical protein